MARNKGGDGHLVSPQAPIRSPGLLLTGSAGSNKNVIGLLWTGLQRDLSTRLPTCFMQSLSPPNGFYAIFNQIDTVTQIQKTVKQFAWCVNCSFIFHCGVCKVSHSHFRKERNNSVYLLAFWKVLNWVMKRQDFKKVTGRRKYKKRKRAYVHNIRHYCGVCVRACLRVCVHWGVMGTR